MLGLANSRRLLPFKAISKYLIHSLSFHIFLCDSSSYKAPTELFCARDPITLYHFASTVNSIFFLSSTCSCLLAEQDAFPRMKPLHIHCLTSWESSQISLCHTFQFAGGWAVRLNLKAAVSSLCWKVLKSKRCHSRDVQCVSNEWKSKLI